MVVVHPISGDQLVLGLDLVTVTSLKAALENVEVTYSPNRSSGYFYYVCSHRNALVLCLERPLAVILWFARWCIQDMRERRCIRMTGVQEILR